MTTILDLPVEEYMLPGNRSCAGCGLGIGLRYILKALDGKCIMVVPASCLTVLGGMYPVSSVRVPWINSVFPGTAAVASGVSIGLKALNKENDYTVLAMAGDGGTVDIGIQGLSGASERNQNFLYICYDNEAYMNTGTQRSGATPRGVKTTTTPLEGKRHNPKDMPKIMEAHNIPYVATACVAYPIDLYDKVKKAKDIKGLRYIHLLVPCPSGWQYDPKDTVNIGQLAVETGAFILYEVENGELRLTGRSRRIAMGGKLKSIDEYLNLQNRFLKFTPEEIEEYQKEINQRWEILVKRDKSLQKEEN
ncbi:MAG: thiamine pyrophosphate-dependent enzyme [Candidatus Hydrogenedentes bacterium]|nr:thiamine pyrophosphate-dependent enzyme [Candidatus Hydrogenedentota bacterium]